jgi:ADP-ribose pyrophosphatase YjhB (NUDIX family)
VNKPLKRSIAVVALNSKGRLLSVRRPDDDDELPGIWGLPAGSYRDSETREDLIRRIGRDKLGVTISPSRLLAVGSQERASYRLEMELWAVTILADPSIPSIPSVIWKWADLSTLQSGSLQGSLCCQLALQSLGEEQ